MLFNELVATNKLHMRHVVAVRKEWLEALLPRLQQANVSMLNGEVPDERNVAITAAFSKSKPESSKSLETKPKHDDTKSAKSKIEEARERYLSRKRDRDGSVKT